MVTFREHRNPLDTFKFKMYAFGFRFFHHYTSLSCSFHPVSAIMFPSWDSVAIKVHKSVVSTTIPPP